MPRAGRAGQSPLPLVPGRLQDVRAGDREADARHGDPDRQSGQRETRDPHAAEVQRRGRAATEQELADEAARADRTGMFNCPHTGVGLAALRKLVDRKLVRANDRVVVISTANGLKFADQKAAYHMGALEQSSRRIATSPSSCRRIRSASPAPSRATSTKRSCWRPDERPARAAEETARTEHDVGARWRAAPEAGALADDADRADGDVHLGVEPGSEGPLRRQDQRAHRLRPVREPDAAHRGVEALRARGRRRLPPVRERHGRHDDRAPRAALARYSRRRHRRQLPAHAPVPQRHAARYGVEVSTVPAATTKRWKTRSSRRPACS